MNKYILYIFVLLGYLLNSCSKEKDEFKPIIDISAPTYLQSVKAGDVINVVGVITDDNNIESVRVNLRDENNVPVLSSFSKSFSSEDKKSYNLNTSISFDDLHMVAGEYNFKITAFDGENTSAVYVPIVFEEAVKKKEGAFVVSNDGSKSTIYQLDNNNVGTFFTVLNGDFIGTAIDLRNQQLICAAQSSGFITALDIISKNEVWSIPVQSNPPIPYFKGFYFFDQNIYLGKESGGVQGYNSSGNPNFSTGTTSGHYMESALIHDEEYLLIEENSIAINGSRNVSLTWVYSGVRVQQTAINSDVKGIFSLSQNKIVFLTNSTSSLAEVKLYDIPTGGISSSFNISSLGEIIDCIEIRNGVYLVATNGNLTLVNVNNHSTLGFLTGVPADRIWYDDLTNELYVADGNMLSVYDYTLRTVKATYTHPEDIKEVLFWYNK